MSERHPIGTRLMEEWSAAALGFLNDLKEAGNHPPVLVDHIGGTAQGEGIVYPEDLFAAAREGARTDLDSGAPYSPAASGRPSARAAIAGYYGRRGVPTEPGAVYLTPGTSFGYHAALRLLASRGDNILVPSPGYPLFDDLCALCGVTPRRYHLRHSNGIWAIDPEEIAFQVTPRTRAIAVVSPHNPTGTIADAAILSALGEICRNRGLALLFDEVFCEFLDTPGRPMSRPVDDEFPLVLTLNGFSKMFSLPGWKIAWVRAGGAESARFGRAMEHLLDTFLPMPEFIQALAGPLMERGDPAVLDRLSAEVAVRRAAKAGWLGIRDPGVGTYLCVPMADGENDLAVARDLFQAKGMETHPGSYYDMPGHLILSCYTNPPEAAGSAEQVKDFLANRGKYGVSGGKNP
jgi:alanine-synthesizing transaminase